MTTTETTIDAHSAIELILSNRVRNEPGFLEQVVLDPAGTINPIIAEVAQDDDIDLSDFAINVHVKTPKTLHFVVDPGADEDPDAEVSGYASFAKFDLGFEVRRPVFRNNTVENNTTTDTACHTNVCKSKAAGSCPAQEFKMY